MEMNLRSLIVIIAEQAGLPDPVLRAAVALRVGQLARRLAAADPYEERVVAALMAAQPTTRDPGLAQAQHYGMPAEFFALMLGPRRKYSCCLYDDASTLAEAEERALAETAAHADLRDGQRILEFGCGWGGLSLWLAQRFPRAEIVAVANTASQQRHIEAEAARRGLAGLRVLTADMNAFAAPGRFDRIVSVEMFEHVANWSALLGRMHDWLDHDGQLFLHIVSHRTHSYRFKLDTPRDWVTRYFLTNGIMPGHGLLRMIDAPFTMEQEWRWSGMHYRRTAEDWLVRSDANAAAIAPLLAATYGDAALLWRRRWRLFLLSIAGLFGRRDGAEWGVSHYRLRPR
ncbi:MAG: SAM-dependent methyltransferase [Acetobacteraceae bacterium]